MLVDEILSPAQCIVPDSSEVYDDLLRFVETHYQEYPRETRAIVFSIAYTRYSKTKKRNINKVYVIDVDGNNKAQNTEKIRILIIAAAQDNRYETDCREALTLFEKLNTATMKLALDSIDVTFDRKLSPIQATLTRLEAPPRPGFAVRARRFARHGLHHAGLLLLAGAYLTALGAALKFALPTVMQRMLSVVEEIFKPLN